MTAAQRIFRSVDRSSGSQRSAPAVAEQLTEISTSAASSSASTRGDNRRDLSTVAGGVVIENDESTIRVDNPIASSPQVPMVHASAGQDVQIETPDQTSANRIFRSADLSAEPMYAKTPDTVIPPDPRKSKASAVPPSSFSVPQAGASAPEFVSTNTAVKASEFRAAVPRMVRLEPTLRRSPAQEIHRSSAVPPAASILPPVGSRTTEKLSQTRADSSQNLMVQRRQFSALSAPAGTTQVQRVQTSSAQAEAFETSVPLPLATATAAEDSASALDVGQLADRVYHMLLSRLSGERSLRGM